MPNPTDLINSALSKKSSVTEAAKAKVQNLTAQDNYNIAAGTATNQAGLISAGSTEQDLRTLNPSQLRGKYGESASDIIANQAFGDRSFTTDATGARDFSQTAADTVSNVGMGVVNSVGGIAALGAGLADADAGSWAAGKLNDFTEWGQSTQSAALQNRRKAMSARNFMNKRDNAALFEEDKKTGSNLMATLKREGRNAVDIVNNALNDPMMMGEGVATGVGSMVAGLPLSRGAKILGLGEKAAMPLAIGAMEGGGAYAQTNQEVQKLSHDELLAQSPSYRKLIESGISPVEAKNQVANRSALMAAAIQAPIGAATGTLVSKFEGAPLSSGSLRQTAGNLIRETVEEGTQSITGQVAQNFGQKTFAQKNKDLGEGVGEQAGLGALYGLGTAGAVQIPATVVNGIGAVGKTAWQGVKLVAGATSTALANQASKIDAKNEKASPLSDAVVEKSANEVMTEAPEVAQSVKAAIDESTATPEQKTEANDFVDSVKKSYGFAKAVEVQPWWSADDASTVDEATNRVSAIARIAKRVASTEGQDQLRAAAVLHQLLEPMLDLQKAKPEALDSIPADSPARVVLDRYTGLIANIDNNVSVKKALDAVRKIYAEQENAGIPTVTETQLNTDEGVGIAKAAVAVASISPDKGNLETAKLVLKHAIEGKLNLNTNERAALQTSISLLQAQRTLNEYKVKNNIQTDGDFVSQEVTTRDDGKETKGKSALKHTKDVVAAMRANNLPLAYAFLEDFGKFVSHMQNKVIALNDHLTGNDANAPGVQYQMLTPDATREFVQSKRGLSVRPTKPGSILNAQTIDMETRILTDVFNGLVEAFPDLKIEPQTYTPLDSLLDGDANEVANEFRTKRRTVVPSTGVVDQPSVVSPKEQPKVESEKASVQTTEPEAKQKVVDEAPNTPEVVAPEPEKKVVPVPEVAAISSMDSLFPNLVNHVPNFFKKAFKLSKEAKTRIIGLPNPMSAIQNALKSNAAMGSFLGSEISGTANSEIVKAYQDLFNGPMVSMQETMRANLEKFLDSKYSKEYPITFREMFTTGASVKTSKGEPLLGSEMNRWVRGKALNITEQEGDGYAYNQELLDAATMAGMQWLIDSTALNSIMDDADVQSLTGIEDLQGDLLNRVMDGQSLEQAKRAIARKITNYWGVSANPSVDKAYTEGIAESVAGEILRALIAQNLVGVDKIKLTVADGLPVGSDPKTIDRYITNKEAIPEAIRAFPDAIESLVMIEPEGVVYMGDRLPPVPKGQMNNEDVPLTADQISAIKQEQKTPFYVDTHMLGFFNSLGLENLLNLFGAGDTENRPLNKEHKASLEGQNRNVAAAFEQMQNVFAQLQNHADAVGKPVTEMATRYAYNMSRVGRMQMLGKYNPQANKLMREAFLPTWSTLNMTNNGEHKRAFTLALGQAMGVKVHTLSMEQITSKIQTIFANGLEPAIEILEDWMGQNDTTDPMNTSTLSTTQSTAIKDAFKAAGADLTVHALHGLVEYVRLQRMEDKSAFKTSLYLEADGVTNGPINAMMLMTPGNFQEYWVKNVAKGGMFFGSARTMNEHRADKVNEGNIDLYQQSTSAAKSYMIGNLKSLETSGDWRDGRLVNMNRRLLTLMDITMPDVKFDPEKEFADGALELARGVAKNPLTITLYGSGIEGIASKLTNQVKESTYEKLSSLAQAQAANPKVTLADALFEGNESKAAQFIQSLQDLSEFVVTTTKKGATVFEAKDVGPRITEAMLLKNPTGFTFDKAAIKNMTQNMKEMFVTPMRAGIDDTVGHPLMEAVGQLRLVTQVQSLFLKYDYQASIQEALDEKIDSPDWRAGDFLSANELKEINKTMQNRYPLVQTETQNFLIAKSASADVNTTAYGRALDGTMRTAAFTYAPDEAGVAGIPFLTIGMGDGMMMQTLANMGLKGTMKIFDGMNMPLDKINEYSNKANQAVYESWKGNPHRAASNAFKSFLDGLMHAGDKDARKTIEGFGKEFQDRLASVLYSKEEIAEGVDSADMLLRIKSINASISRTADSIDARHEVIQSMATSVDQMAAASSPFVNGNQVFAIEPTTEEVLDELNKRYAAKMNKPTKVAVPKTIADMGTLHKTGARVISWTGIKKLSTNPELTDAQRLILGEINRSLGTKEYKVVTGTAEQILAYQTETGRKVLGQQPKGELKGYVTFDDQMIYLVNPSTETLVHELVHAASFETLMAHYEGSNVGTEITDAVTRLERMMLAFLDMDSTSLQGQAAIDLQDAQNAVNAYKEDVALASPEAKASALNEFMAWSLTNQNIVENLATKKVSSLVQIAKDAVKAIKQLIWGKKKSLPVADDFLSNLQFNAGIIIRSQPSLAKSIRQGSLFHLSTDDRLSRVRDAYADRVGDYLSNVTLTSKNMTRVQVQSNAAQIATDLSRHAQANGFAMSANEATTFEMIVSTLATEASIDTNALARAQELYSYVTKNLTVENFMVDPKSTNPNDRFHAQEQYNFVVGKTVQRQDLQRRSSLLPVFLGLATVNAEMRAVLAKMPVPKASKSTEKTMDAMLENLGNEAMDKLSVRLSGQGNARNVQEAIDNLQTHIQEVLANERTYANEFLNKTGNFSDAMNDKVVAGLQNLSDVGTNFGTKLTASTSKITRVSGEFIKAISGVVSERNGEQVAQGVMTLLNKTNAWKPFSHFVGDLVGRTKSNEKIYDMIKATRAMVQQTRQQFRDDVPRIISEKFSRELEPKEWTALFHGLGKTDLATLVDGMSHDQILNLFGDHISLDSEVATLEKSIEAADAANWKLYQDKAKQLANYMNTGIAGKQLLRNANAIGRLLNMPVSKNYIAAAPDVVKAIDKLVTLYAVQGLSQETKNSLSSLVQEKEGMSFTLSYLVGQRAEEQRKANTDGAYLNHYKGHVPSSQQESVSLIVADDSKHAKLVAQSYVPVGNYKGSSVDPDKTKRSYYMLPVNGRAAFNQGILQNVRQTVSGVDQTTGFTLDMTAGRITDPVEVNMVTKRLFLEAKTDESLLPVFNVDGKVIAYERSIDPMQLLKLNKSTHLAKQIGIWRGRQVEEGKAAFVNSELVNNLGAMYYKDLSTSASNKDQYVNLLTSKDPVIRDAVRLMTTDTRKLFNDAFGKNQIWVRKDMIDDAIGYRAATVGDVWTGNSRWSKQTQDTVRTLAVSVFGNNAYRYLVNVEQKVMNFMGDARTTIVVKSVIVPMTNFVSNILQLINRGVPIKNIVTGMPAKLAEIESYTKSKIRQIEVEAELRAATNSVQERKLRTEIRSITDSHKRMSIWPLIEAGEFSTIADVGMTHEDVELTSGKLVSYIEKQADKLPKGLQTFGKYGLVTRDTALFHGLQKSVHYGDFLAKAVMYDDLTKRKKLSSEDALARITEEFVNYDRLRGRGRGYLEDIGLLWFYNFKIRSTKVALSMLRNNPLHTLLATNLPVPDFLGSTGTPVQDNVLTKALTGSLQYSVGTGMGLRAPGLNPWYNLIN